MGLWCIPLRPIITNENEDTLVLDSTCGHHSTNTRYIVPPTTRIRDHLCASLDRENHTILNVYELPSIEHTIRYLHAAAGYPTKSTWLTAILAWKLQHLATCHYQECEQAFPTIRRDPTRTHEKPTPRHTFHQTTRSPHRTTTNPTTTT